MWRKALLISIILFTLFVPTITAQTIDTEVDTVILASTENYPDALVAGSAAAKISSPVLLTAKGELTAETRAALDRLSPTNVVVVGGEEVVSADVKEALEGAGYDVTRLWGTTRYGTAVEVAEHFWMEGAEEAVLVQNSLEDGEGRVLAAAKELARDDETPVYLTREGTVPAVVLSSLENLGVEEVTVVGTAISADYRDDLAEIGVEIDEEITGESDDEVEADIRARTDARLNQSQTLLVVASTNFQHHIAASHMPNHRVVHVRSENGISSVIDTVNDRDVTRVLVGGTPVLAEQTATSIRAETDAEVDLRVAQAAAAIQLNANLTGGERERFAELHEKRIQRWEERRQQHEELVKQRVNRTINKAEDMIDENSSEEARELLDKARVLYSDGKYVEAREAASEALNDEREARWEERREREEAVRESMEEEMESLQERIEEMQDLNADFAAEMEENMTVKERLEVIEEFRHERRETVRKLVEEARRTDADIEEDLRKRFDGARDRVRERSSEERFRFNVECTDESADGTEHVRGDISGHDGAVRAEGRLLLPTPNYRAASSYEKGDYEIDLSIDLTGSDGFGIQCVGEARYKYKVDAAAGNWSVNLDVTVDGETIHTASETVTVTRDDDEGEEHEDETENDSSDVDDVQCRADVEFAKLADDGRACTQQIQTLQCPHEDSFTYDARNGCQISALQERDWTAAEHDDGAESDEEEEDSTLPTSLTLESTDGEGCDTTAFFRDGEAVEAVDVPAGEEVTITFQAREDCTYYAGVEYRSPHFTTDPIDGGERTQATFTAQEDFTITAYWPSSGVRKASVKMDVE